MDIINLVAIIITITALFSYLNYRFLRLPITIGVLVIAIITSFLVQVLDIFIPNLAMTEKQWVRMIDFDEALLNGMLSALLFAGALHINLQDLSKQKWVISILATLGVLFSTVIIGHLMFYTLMLIGIDLPLIYCLIFGALISPTDPIAVLAILKQVGAPKTMETKISGESLFNDGIGVVIFTVLAGIAVNGEAPSLEHALVLFTEEAFGGIIYGLALGYVSYLLIRSVDNYHVEIILTLAIVLGGYALARQLHVSGPLAIVVVGLMIGNHGRYLAMSKKTRANMDTFWELIDEILNAILFVLIGLEVVLIQFSGELAVAGLAAIMVVLIARFISVGVPITIMRPFRSFSPDIIKIMTWSGLRGGISVAMALTLPAGEQRDIILTITYIVVVFSILVQGLSIGKLIQLSLEKTQHKTD